mgnify:CR=1 FL=1
MAEFPTHGRLWWEVVLNDGTHQTFPATTHWMSLEFGVLSFRKRYACVSYEGDSDITVVAWAPGRWTELKTELETSGICGGNATNIGSEKSA